MTAAVALGFQSCSDWDDHYSAGNGALDADATLWEQISSRPDLSNFAQLLQKEGYDTLYLNTNQSFTVWAPTNDAVDLTYYNSLSDSLLKAEFLNNHIARGYHRAVGEVSERVHLLNKKVMDFEGNGNYTIGALAIDSTNIAGKNGVMHIMNGMMNFRPNFYELFNRNSNLSSLGEIFSKKMKREIDTDKSVEGSMVNGEITYLDTVYTESNTLFTSINAKLNNEDSTYTFLVPTNEAWQKAYTKVASYNKLPKAIQPFTIENDDNTGKLTYTQGSSVDVAADSLQNEYTTVDILTPLVFSHTTNKVLKNGNLPSGALDSIQTTTYLKVCNTENFMGGNESYYVNDATDMFVGTEKYVTSNGYAFITDSLRIKPWNYWCPIIHLRAQNGSYQAGTDNVSLASNVTVSASDRNPNVHGSLHATSYYNVESTLGSRPDVYFYIPAPYSTSYAVYLTMVPANITDTTAVPSDQKIMIRSLMHTAAGKAPTSLSPSPLKSDFGSSKNYAGTTFDYGTAENAKIQTKFVGVFTPNFSYRGLPGSQTALPVLNVRTTSSIKGESTVLRIAAITLVPKEAIDYFKEKGEYESYTDEMPEIFWHINGSTY